MNMYYVTACVLRRRSSFHQKTSMQPLASPGIGDALGVAAEPTLSRVACVSARPANTRWQSHMHGGGWSVRRCLNAEVAMARRRQHSDANCKPAGCNKAASNAGVSKAHTHTRAHTQRKMQPHATQQRTIPQLC
eukprot:451342-Alexandrium_andersonii.AAC.1